MPIKQPQGCLSQCLHNEGRLLTWLNHKEMSDHLRSNSEKNQGNKSVLVTKNPPGQYIVKRKKNNLLDND